MDPNKYIMPLGKYKGMYLHDVAKLTIVDKNNIDKKVGIQYLNWLIQQSWYRDTDIVMKILKQYETEEEVDVNEPKKEIKEKKINKTVKIEVNKTIDMS